MNLKNFEKSEESGDVADDTPKSAHAPESENGKLKKEFLKKKNPWTVKRMKASI